MNATPQNELTACELTLLAPYGIIIVVGHDIW